METQNLPITKIRCKKSKFSVISETEKKKDQSATIMNAIGFCIHFRFYFPRKWAHYLSPLFPGKQHKCWMHLSRADCAGVKLTSCKMAEPFPKCNIQDSLFDENSSGARQSISLYRFKVACLSDLFIIFSFSRRIIILRERADLLNRVSGMHAKVSGLQI